MRTVSGRTAVAKPLQKKRKSAGPVAVKRVTKIQRRTQQERSAEARSRLIAAAISLICEVGYSRTTMAQIASDAGMTRGAIQHHFSGRDTLVLAILDALEQQILDAFERVEPDRHIPVEKKLDAVIDALGGVALSDAYLAVLDIWVATRADRALAVPVRAAIVRASRHYRDLWERIFHDDLRKETYEDALRIIVGMLRGMVVSRIFEVTPRSNELTISICKDAARRRMLVSAGPRDVQRHADQPAGREKRTGKLLRA